MVFAAIYDSTDGCATITALSQGVVAAAWSGVARANKP